MWNEHAELDPVMQSEPIVSNKSEFDATLCSNCTSLVESREKTFRQAKTKQFWIVYKANELFSLAGSASQVLSNKILVGDEIKDVHNYMKCRIERGTTTVGRV